MTTPTVQERDETAPTQHPATTPLHRWGWLAGMLGAAAALAVGELFANFNESVNSLVTSIGEIVIDVTPGDLVAESINTIGQLQKPLLLGGITVVAILVGGWIGDRGRRQSWFVPAGFGLFGLIGGWAGARSELTSASASFGVAIFAAFIGIVVTQLLLTSATPSVHTPQRPADNDVVVPGSPLSKAGDRRRFLAFGGAALGTAAVYAGSRTGRTTAAERAREELLTNAASSTTTTVADGATASTIADPVMAAGEFDGIPGITSHITPINPTDEFYLIDTALTKPQVDPANWSLTIDGEYVTTPVSYTFDELLNRDLIEKEVTLSCVSNPVGGGLVGNAVWQGIPLSELFEEAGIIDPTDANTQVFSRSVDGFTCGFPTPLAYDGRTAMLAVRMNGEPLPIKHGFPARIVVAGLYGYVSATKWIEKISITDWIGVDGFWMPRGWSKEGPIKTQSRIDVPRSGQQIKPGPTTLGGIAWSPTIGIDGVEVSFAEDEWVEAELADIDSDETWVQWKLDWDPDPADYTIQVRATDKSGFTQSPIPVAPAPNGAEGYHTIRVRVG
ncbi:MAG: molybdopterin-dependent oxidoreductase [Acidimicrobiales bacterium]